MQVRNRFMGGASFLPLFAAETGAGNGGEQAELVLDPKEVAEHGDPDFEANDPNDIGHKSEDEDPPVKAEEPVAEEPKEEPVAEDKDAELEQLRKTAKALGKRVSVLSKEKRELSTKLQQTIKPVAEEPAETETEQPQRSDFKTQAEFQEAVRQEAARQRAADDFTRKCNEVEAAGSKAYKAAWAKAKQDLAMLDDHGNIPIDILSVALETDDPARVLFVLGNDIDKATELMGMTPIKRAIAMDKIAASKPAAPVRQQSKAPPPIDPIGGRGATDDAPRDTDSDEEWNRKEEARERRLAEERRKRGVF